MLLRVQCASKSMRLYLSSYIRHQHLMSDRIQTVGQGRVGTRQHLFVLYWTGKLPLDTSAWTAFQEAGMRTQIRSLAQVACRKFIRQWGDLGHACRHQTWGGRRAHDL